MDYAALNATLQSCAKSNDITAFIDLLKDHDFELPTEIHDEEKNPSTPLLLAVTSGSLICVKYIVTHYPEQLHHYVASNNDTYLSAIYLAVQEYLADPSEIRKSILHYLQSMGATLNTPYQIRKISEKQRIQRTSILEHLGEAENKLPPFEKNTKKAIILSADEAESFLTIFEKNFKDRSEDEQESLETCLSTSAYFDDPAANIVLEHAITSTHANTTRFLINFILQKQTITPENQAELIFESIKKKNREAIVCFIENGWNFHIKNALGQSSAEYALELIHLDIRNEIRGHYHPLKRKAKIKFQTQGKLLDNNSTVPNIILSHMYTDDPASAKKLLEIGIGDLYQNDLMQPYMQLLAMSCLGRRITDNKENYKPFKIFLCSEESLFTMSLGSTMLDGFYKEKSSIFCKFTDNISYDLATIFS